ncbi:MAG: glycosyltransferase family 39 protein [Herbaspirillum sp.]
MKIAVSKTFLLVLILLYVIPGLIGHDPWKQDETYVFGIIYSMFHSGDWIVPMVAGEPFMEKPPLFYWIAVLFGKLLAPPLALHDAARLASGFFTLTILFCIERCGRLCWGQQEGRITAIALMSTLGLLFHAHIMETDIALLAGFAIALLGLCGARTGNWKSGVLLGLGTGVGFLSKGVLAPATLGLVCVLLPLLFREWRTASFYRNCLIALVVALPWLLIWPLLLFLRSPQLFMDWFWLNNVGRFVGFSVPLLGAPHQKWFWSRTIPWLTFPILPLALYSLYLFRRKQESIIHNPVYQLCLVMIAVLGAVLFSAASARAMYGLPLLLPLAILATPGALALSAGFNRRTTWSVLSVFMLLGVGVWFVWARMWATGTTLQLSYLQRHLPNEFLMPFSPFLVTLAVLVTLAALWLAWTTLRNRLSAVVSFAIGLSLLWGLIMTLWVPWIDQGKSYRSTFVSLGHVLPRDATCLASVNLGESERAMLHYVNGTITQRLENGVGAACPWLLVQGFAQDVPEQVRNSPDRVVWEGARDGDRSIRFWLLKQN